MNLLPRMDRHLHLAGKVFFVRAIRQWQAVRFAELPKTRPAHRQSLLTSTGPRTRLHLSHRGFVLTRAKMLAVTQVELTEYSPDS